MTSLHGLYTAVQMAGGYEQETCTEHNSKDIREGMCVIISPMVIYEQCDTDLYQNDQYISVSG